MRTVSRREFMKTTVATGVTAALAGGQLEAREEENMNDRPNLLLIMTDQHRKDAMGIYGNPVIRTPHLDSLGKGGVVFENCYSQNPVCMPARATIFTGRYPSAHGVWSNGVPLPENEITLAHHLAANGYQTGGAGKFHFIPHYPYRSPMPTMETHPEPFYGFQEFHIGEDGRCGEHCLWIEQNHPEFKNKGDHEIPLEVHNSYWSASHTIEFIRHCAREGDPFFAFCSFVDPHHSYNPPEPYRSMYSPEEVLPPIRREGELEGMPPFLADQAGRMKKQNENVAQNRAQYYGEVTFIDDSIGRILETLEELGLRENTLIIFVADHGDLLGDHWLYYKGKPHYAGCANVPLIMNWKGHLQEGKVVENIVQQTDLLPTVVDLFGLENPPGIQGKSLGEVVTTVSMDTGTEYAYIECPTSGEVDPNANWDPKRGLPGRSAPCPYTVRSLQWRLTYYPGYEYGELYDLEADPNEFTNLWDDERLRDKKQELKEVLLARLIETRDPLPRRINYY